MCNRKERSPAWYLVTICTMEHNVPLLSALKHTYNFIKKHINPAVNNRVSSGDEYHYSLDVLFKLSAGGYHMFASIAHLSTL